MSTHLLSEAVAQLLFVRLGSNMEPSVHADDDADRVEALLRELPIGGLVVFNGDAGTTPDTLARLQQASSNPLLVGTDMERGLGQQFAGATVFPHAYAFGACGSDAETYIEEAAFAAGVEALAAGVHMSFSPVADVHSNPDNPIISIRAFGSTAEDVAARAAAYIRGASRAGILTTAKHFPGHGDTSTDSHVEVPVVKKSKAELKELELSPFRQVVQEDVDALMTAHVSFPALDPCGAVATRSRAILTDLLRREMNFEGAVVTDSLLMEGAQTDETDWAVDIVNAGADILLDVRDAFGVHARLLNAVRDGKIAESRIESANKRIQRLRSRLSGRFGQEVFTNPAAAYPPTVIGRQEHERLASLVARRAVSVTDRTAGDAPLSGGGRGLMFVLVRPHVTYSDPTAGSIERLVSGAFDPCTFVEVGPDTTADTLENLVMNARAFAAVVVAAAVKPAAWHRFGLLTEQSDFVHHMIARRPTILAAIGSDRWLDAFPGAAMTICTFSDVQASCGALVAFLVDEFRGSSSFVSSSS